MCVFICANPTVHLWLNAITAHAERDLLQVAGGFGPTHEDDDRATLPDSVVQQIPRGQMLRGPYWPRREEEHYDDASLETRKHPFDALADAWCRLLALVGLRR